VEWEGERILEKIEEVFPKEFKQVEPEAVLLEPSSEESAGSGDEYVEDDDKTSGPGRPKKKVCLNSLSE
jgi:hypothetical protein